jgi:cytochrome c-type biogenesis protein CcmH
VACRAWRVERGARSAERGLRSFVVFLVFLSLVRPAVAQEPPSDDDVNRVASELVCPVCEGIPLDVCTTEACAQWRSEIRAQLELGASDDEIKAEFVRQYGERVLALPAASGFTLWIWIVPPAALLLGALGLWAYLRRSQPAATTASSSVDAVDSEAQAAIEREVRDQL